MSYIPTSEPNASFLLGEKTLGYYRRYIPDFAQFAKPIYELLNKPKMGGSSKVSTKRTADSGNEQLPTAMPIK